MNNRPAFLLVGVVIIAVGVTALLDGLKILPYGSNVIGALLLLGGAAFFLHWYRRERSRPLLLLPVILMTAWGLVEALSPLAPVVKELETAVFFFSLFGYCAYLFTRHEQFWWTVIPAGLSFTLGTLVLVRTLDLLNSDYGGFVFLTGAGLTFLYLWGLQRGAQIFPWAIWPAVLFFLLALFALADAVPWFSKQLLLALLLIAVGGRLLLSHWLKGR